MIPDVMVITLCESVLSLLSISPLSTVTLATQFRWSRVFSVVAKPPYSATPFVSTNEALMLLELVVGLYSPAATQISVGDTACVVRAYCKSHGVAQLLPH